MLPYNTVTGSDDKGTDLYDIINRVMQTSRG